ncbi:MAG: hypothetical protein Kapaf2KO_03720 [Candidatus Kapaibacteriales bacterium]
MVNTAIQIYERVRQKYCYKGIIIDILSLRLIALSISALALTLVSAQPIYSRVIPYEDIRTVQLGSEATIGISNFGLCGGATAPLTFRSSSTIPDYTFTNGVGVFLLYKHNGKWNRSGTVSGNNIDSELFPGSYTLKVVDSLDRVNLSQVYLAKDYDKETGYERFGGEGPRWPLVLNNTLAQDRNYVNNYQLGEYFGMPESLDSVLSLKGFDIRPHFPEDIIAFSVSHLLSSDSTVIIEIENRYFNIPSTNQLEIVTSIRNYGQTVDSLYIIPYADFDIKNEHNGLFGFSDDLVCKTDFLVDIYGESIPFTSLYAGSMKWDGDSLFPNSNEIDSSFIAYFSSIYSTPVNGQIPVYTFSDYIQYRILGLKSPRTILGYEELLPFLSNSEILSLIKDTITDNICEGLSESKKPSDIDAAYSIGPLKLGAFDGRYAQRYDIISLLGVSKGIEDPNYTDNIHSAIKSTLRNLFDKTYLSVEKILYDSQNPFEYQDRLKLYFDGSSNAIYYIDFEKGKKIYIDVLGRTLR